MKMVSAQNDLQTLTQSFRLSSPVLDSIRIDR